MKNCTGGVSARTGLPWRGLVVGRPGKMTPVRRLLTLVVVVLLPLLVVACGGGTTEDTAPQDVETGAATDTGGGETTDTGGETTDTGGETTETNGEDGGGEGDPEAGADVFASAGCGSCHVLEAAGTSGSVGPNLDESDVDYEGAEQQIRQGGGGMPAYEGQLSDEEIANVAAFVTEDSR